MGRRVASAPYMGRILAGGAWRHARGWQIVAIMAMEKAFPAACSLGNLPNLWSFLDSTLLCSLGGMGPPRFYHVVWPFYVAILISPYHGDLEKARVMLRGVNPVGSHDAHMWAISDFVPMLSNGSH